MRNYIPKNLIGQTFNRLTVIDFAISKKSGRQNYTTWKCQCICGMEVDVRATCLVNNKIKSCGCLLVEERAKAIRKNYGESTFNKIYYDYKASAIKNKREFSLTKENFKELIFRHCSYCNSPPSRLVKIKNHYGELIVNGLDRVDNNKGYIEDNSVTCCWLCNEKKKATSEKEFLNWIEKIYNFRIKDKNETP